MEKKIARRLVTIAAIMAIAFVGAFSFTVSEAASPRTPGQVKKIKATGIRSNEATLNWNAAAAPVRGYTIFRNGTAIRHVEAKVLSFKDTSLKPSTQYTYTVKAYIFTGQTFKQWYNTKTKKWQNTKPEKNALGNSRVVPVRRYGKASPSLTFKTQKAIVIQGRTVKASEFTKKNNYTIKFTKKGTACPVCKQGVTVTIKYSPATGKYSATTKGTDYSKKCHHHNKFDIRACEGDHHHYAYDAKTKCRWFRESDGREINPKTGAVIGTQTKAKHSDNFRKATQQELNTMKYADLVKKYPNPTGDKKSVLCSGRKSYINYKFCKDCKKIIP